MSTIDPVALVPVRDPRSAKTRLSPVLDDRERATLVGAMLADVVAALAGADLARVVVLAGGDEAAAAARALGVDVLLDPPGGGIDAAIGAAGRSVRAVSSLVVPADLPLLTPEDVRALLAEPGDVVVAPTSDGGTGGLLRRPAWVMRTSFGGRSAARHLLMARRSGLSAERVEIAGFSLDVDEPEDLARALTSDRLGRVTAAVLREMDAVAERVAAFERSGA